MGVRLELLQPKVRLCRSRHSVHLVQVFRSTPDDKYDQISIMKNRTIPIRTGGPAEPGFPAGHEFFALQPKAHYSYEHI